jgi:hypothetical protein
MKRGTWTDPKPLERRDEFGDIIHAFNELGEALTLADHQHANSSKLAVLSLIGQRLLRRTKLAADHVSSIAVLLGVARKHGQSVPENAIRNLELTAKDLHRLQAEVEGQFQEQCERWVPGVQEKVGIGKQHLGEHRQVRSGY